jgi:hypothetical protein
MGIALTRLHARPRGSPLFELPTTKRSRSGGDPWVSLDGDVPKWMPASEIIDELLGAVVPDLPFVSGDQVSRTDRCGLGGTPISEAHPPSRIAHEKLPQPMGGSRSGETAVGEYCTSLDMAGASLTLVKLDDEIEQLRQAPAEVAVQSSRGRLHGILESRVERAGRPLRSNGVAFGENGSMTNGEASRRIRFLVAYGAQLRTDAGTRTPSASARLKALGD